MPDPNRPTRYLPRIIYSRDLEGPLEYESNQLDATITRIVQFNEQWKDDGLTASSDLLIAELVMALHHANKLQMLTELTDAALERIGESRATRNS